MAKLSWLGDDRATIISPSSPLSCSVTVYVKSAIPGAPVATVTHLCEVEYNARTATANFRETGPINSHIDSTSSIHAGIRLHIAGETH